MAGRTLLALLVACPLVFSPFTLESFEQPKLAVLLLGALALAAAWVARPFGRPLGPLELAWAAGLASAALSTALSVSPRVSFFGAHESWAGLLTVAGYAAVFAAARSLEPGGRWAVAAVAAAGVGALYALAQRFGIDAVAWTRTASYAGETRPFGTLGHPNLAAALFAMTAPLALWVAARSSRRLALLGLGAAFSALMAATVLALSRAGWLAMAGAVGVVLTGWLIAGERAALKKAVVLLVVAAAVSGAVLGSLSLGKPPAAEAQRPPDPVTERLRDVGNASTRWFIWTAAWQIFREHPVAGHGLDTFQLAFPRHRVPGYWELEWGATPQRAHDELLQALATQGVVGGVAYLAVPLAFLWVARRAWRRRERRLELAVLAASASAFWVQGVFGFTTVATGVLFAVVAGRLSALGVDESPAPRAQRSGWVRGPAYALALAGAYLGVVRPLWASVELRVGDERLTRSPASALQLHGDATVVVPGDDVAWTKLGATAQAMARATPQGGEKIRLLGVARHAYERALALVPADGYHRANLARVLGECAAAGVSPAPEAFVAWDDALARDPANGVLLVDAANSALLLGDGARARTWAGRALAQYPRYAPPRAQLGFLALQAGDPELARSELEAALAGDWRDDRRAKAVALTNLASAQLTLGDPGAAREAAEEASRLAPELEGARAVLREVQGAAR